LTRTRIGDFSLQEAEELTDLIEKIKGRQDENL